MDMTGERQLPASVEQAWAALNDPAVLKDCIPGCERFDSTAPDVYAVAMAVKVGPVTARFNGTVSLADVCAPVSYRIVFTGQDRVAGFGKGESRVELVPAEDGCELRYVVAASIGGRLAQIGQRLVDGAARSMAERFFERFEQRLATNTPDGVASTTTPP